MSKSIKKGLFTIAALAVMMLLVMFVVPTGINARAEGVLVEEITFSEANPSVLKSFTKQLVATVYPANADCQDLVWSSADTSIATVSSTGLVTGVSYGITTITATAADGSGVYASCQINVQPHILVLDSPSYNQDCRRIQLSFSIPQELTDVTLHVGNRSFNITRPATGDFDQTYSGSYPGYNRIKVSFSQVTGSTYVTWYVQMKLSIPTSPGSTESIWLNMSGNGHSLDSTIESGYVFWYSYITTSLGDGEKIKPIITAHVAANQGYNFKLYNALTENEITYDENTNVATGMCLIKRQVSTIYSIEYFVLFGDVNGGGAIGDGAIDTGDALAVLRHYAGTGLITSDLLLIAADVDHNGIVDMADAQTIMNYAAYGYGYLIEQYYPVSITNGVYFGTSVTFI